MGRKLALVIGNSQYDDAGLARLPTADVDVRELADVLRAQEVGQFDDVIEVANQGVAVVRRAVAYFFNEAKRDDLLLLYFSGHGVKDEQGHLYLAVKDTERPVLAGTGIEAAFITAQMDRSHSKRQVLILDCCHSGAFAYGVKAAEAGVVGTGPAFEGSGFGRVVLTATDSTQYAWEGDRVIGGESDKSVFTHYLLQGLKTGEADCDDDGLITIDELYDYVYEHVVRETPKQTPGKWTYKQEGNIVVARNPHPIVRSAELPMEVRALLESPLLRLRVEAIPELVALLQGPHRGLALAARKALEGLRLDDSRKVSAAAEGVLATFTELRDAGALVKQPDAGSLPVEPALAAAVREEERRAREERAAADEAEARRREELEQRARERRQKVAALVGRAEQAASHQAAIEALNEALGLDPAHETARQLLAHRTAAFEQEQRRQEEERRRAEAERVAREREIASLREAARRHVDRQQYVEALDTVRRVWQIDPNASGLTEVVETAQALKAAAEEAERRRREPKGRLAAGSTESPKQTRDVWVRHLSGAITSVQSALNLQRLSQPLQIGLVAVFAVSSLVVYGLYGGAGREATAPATPQVSEPVPPRQVTPEPPPPVIPPSDTAPAPAPSTIGRGQERAPEPAAQGAPPVNRGAAPRPRQTPPSEPPAVDTQVAPRPNDASQAVQVQQRLSRAEQLQDTGDYDGALRAIDEALAIDPKNTAARDLRQRVLDAQNFERALRPRAR